MTERTEGHPIDGAAVLIAGAKASVPLERLPELLIDAQEHLGSRRGSYRRGYECVHDDPEGAAYLVEPGHWRALGGELGLEAREADAVARAHAEQVRRLGRALDRADELETALEIREAVVIA